MYIVYKNIEEWLKKEPDLEQKFKDTYGFLVESIHRFSLNFKNHVKVKTGEDIEITFSTQLLKQSLIDAFDDLLRLKNYHPTKSPSPIKEMSYIAYWVVRRKPIVLATEEIVTNKKLNDIAKSRALFINEAFAVQLLANATFSGKEKLNLCKSEVFEEADNQLKYFKRFMLYYLVYRVSSPKEIEAILLGCTIHPVWKVNPVIWEYPNELIDDEF